MAKPTTVSNSSKQKSKKQQEQEAAEEAAQRAQERLMSETAAPYGRIPTTKRNFIMYWIFVLVWILFISFALRSKPRKEAKTEANRNLPQITTEMMLQGVKKRYMQLFTAIDITQNITHLRNTTENITYDEMRNSNTYDSWLKQCLNLYYAKARAQYENSIQSDHRLTLFSRHRLSSEGTADKFDSAILYPPVSQATTLMIFFDDGNRF